jgi:hypothetical protein
MRSPALVFRAIGPDDATFATQPQRQQTGQSITMPPLTLSVCPVM